MGLKLFIFIKAFHFSASMLTPMLSPSTIWYAKVLVFNQ